MRATRVNHLVLLVLAVVGMASRAYASSVIVVPPGLGPGQTYRLVYVTTGTTNAIASVLGNYNTFVTNQANAVPALAALGATWTVIGSTENESAATNIGISDSGAIYNLAGQEVAPNTAALFSTATTPLLAPIDIYQNGTVAAADVWVWNGTSPYDGSTFTNDAFGDLRPSFGQAAATGYAYLYVDTESNVYAYSLYGISSPLTVGGVTPEPGTIALTALGGAMLLLARRRRQ